MPTPMPTLYISHGSPDLTLRDTPARHFLAGLADRLPRPAAVLVISAHWATPSPAVDVSVEPETIHDFFGFPDALYEIRYPGQGAPELAQKAKAALEAAGLGPVGEDERGLDHGAWIPLMLMYPAGGVPVCQLSMQPGWGAAENFALGAALKPLRDEGVLILASGNLTHNLREMDMASQDPVVPAWVSDFSAWIADRLAAGAHEDLMAYRTRAPYAVENHPSDEHLLPLFVAMGAGTQGTAPERIHDTSITASWPWILICSPDRVRLSDHVCPEKPRSLISRPGHGFMTFLTIIDRL